MASYFSPKIEVRDCRTGKGLFAKEPIRHDEIVIDFGGGPGWYFNTKDAYRHEAQGCHYIIQVENNRYLVSVDGPETGDYINHSCRPNCGIRGAITIVAMRDISPDEEVTFDYAMTESYYYYRLDCLCCTDLCRQVVTGRDWKRKDLQNRYAGYFSDYIERKIHRHPAIHAICELWEKIGLRVYWRANDLLRVLRLRKTE